MDAGALLGTHAPAIYWYVFLFAWLFVESTGFPISDEPVLLLAGYLCSTGRLQPPAVVLCALGGKVAASCLAYALGRRITLERLARPPAPPRRGAARVLHTLRPSSALVQRTEAFFRRWGTLGVFLGRLVPVVRSFISYPAGAAKMPFLRFWGATTAGSLLWIAGWTAAGAALGRSARELPTRWGMWSWAALGAALALFAAWHWARRTRRQR